MLIKAPDPIVSVGLLAACGFARGVDTRAVVGEVGAAIGASDDDEKVVVKERVIYKEFGHGHHGHSRGHHRRKKTGWNTHDD